MEPDIEIIIRKKIQDAEQQPMAWNKTNAWEKINSGGKTESSVFTYFYYAAAALAFFVITLSLIVTQYHKNKFALRISHLESLLHQAEVNTAAKKENNKPAKCTDEPIDLHKKSFSSNPKPRKIKSVLPSIAILREEETFLQSPAQMKASEIALQPEPEKSSVTTTTRIEPIIGVYEPITKTESIAKVKKKNRLEWHRSSEVNSAGEVSKNTFFIARIK